MDGFLAQTWHKCRQWQGGTYTHSILEISVEIEGQAEGRFICSLGAGRPVGIPVAPSSLFAAAECDRILHIPVAFYFLITCFKPLVAGNPFPYLTTKVYVSLLIAKTLDKSASGVQNRSGVASALPQCKCFASG